MVRRIISFILIMAFTLTSVVDSSLAQVLSSTPNLPITSISQAPVFSGIKIYPQEPFRFDFIVAGADEPANDPESAVGAEGSLLPDSSLRSESMRLVKYFMAALTVPEGDLWVNLSPYEPDRIVPKALGQTEMGRDLLAQDYILKQLTASLMSPQGESGKKFWEKVYEKIYQVDSRESLVHSENTNDERLTTIDLIESFNKVWIVPDQVEVYQNGDVAYITKSTLKVMLESDYIAQNVGAGLVPAHEQGRPQGAPLQKDDIKSIIRSVIIPLIEDEVNNGEPFANLRQIFHSMILAKWYEQHFKNSVLGQSYVDQNVVEGIELESLGAHSRAPVQVQDIYDQYVAAFKSGASDLIKEEYDPVTQTVIPKKYFVGGVELSFNPGQMAAPVQLNFAQLNMTSQVISVGVTPDVEIGLPQDSAMLKVPQPLSQIVAGISHQIAVVFIFERILAMYSLF